MRSLHTLTGLLLVIGTTMAAGQAPSGGTFPKDIYPETGNRFPAIKRDAVPDSFGPGAIRQYSPPLAEGMTGVNDYLRRKAGLEPRVSDRTRPSEVTWLDVDRTANAGLPEISDLEQSANPGPPVEMRACPHAG